MNCSQVSLSPVPKAGQREGKQATDHPGPTEGLL